MTGIGMKVTCENFLCTNTTKKKAILIHAATVWTQVLYKKCSSLA